MTINGPAIVLFAFYVALARPARDFARCARGTIQNDCLKEFIAAARLARAASAANAGRDGLIEYATAEVPRYNPVPRSAAITFGKPERPRLKKFGGDVWQRVSRASDDGTAASRTSEVATGSPRHVDESVRCYARCSGARLRGLRAAHARADRGRHHGSQRNTWPRSRLSRRSPTCPARGHANRMPPSRKLVEPRSLRFPNVIAADRDRIVGAVPRRRVFDMSVTEPHRRPRRHEPGVLRDELLQTIVLNRAPERTARNPALVARATYKANSTIAGPLMVIEVVTRRAGSLETSDPCPPTCPTATPHMRPLPTRAAESESRNPSALETRTRWRGLSGLARADSGSADWLSGSAKTATYAWSRPTAVHGRLYAASERKLSRKPKSRK